MVRIFALVFFLVTTSYAQTFHKIQSLDTVPKDSLVDGDLYWDKDRFIRFPSTPKQVFIDSEEEEVCEECSSGVVKVLQKHKEMMEEGE